MDCGRDRGRRRGVGDPPDRQIVPAVALMREHREYDLLHRFSAGATRQGPLATIRRQRTHRLPPSDAMTSPDRSSVGVISARGAVRRELHRAAQSRPEPTRAATA